MSFGGTIGPRRHPTAQQVKRSQTPVTRQLVATASMVDQVGKAIAQADGACFESSASLPKAGIGGLGAVGAAD